MWSLYLAATLSLASVTVEVTSIDGDSYQGKLIGVSSESFTISTPDGDRMVPLSDLLSVIPVESPQPFAETKIRLDLVDGSILHAQDFTVSKGKANVGGKLEIATRSIRTVRFRSHENNSDIKRQWDEINSEDIVGDTLVIRKEIKVASPNDEDRTDVMYSLNSLDGVLHDVTDETVEFEFGGKRIPVPRRKIEGIIYYHPPGRELPSPICRVADADGSAWFVRSMGLEEDGLQIVCVSGVRTVIKLSNVAKFDFSAGNTIYLSDLEPRLVEVKPPLDFGAISSSKKILYEPRMDQLFDGRKLKIVGSEKACEKGISLHSHSTLVFDLPEGAKRFFAKAGIDEAGGHAGRVELSISADRKSLFKGPVTANESVNLDYDVSGYRRLTIVVAAGEKPDHADFLDLCNARITK